MNRDKYNEYNLEPVYYCKLCLSLKITPFMEDDSYCKECGNTDIGQTDIFTWEKMYIERYGHPYVKDKIKKK